MGRGRDVLVIGVGKFSCRGGGGDMGMVRIDGKCIFLGCENGRGPLGVGWSILYSRKGLELRLSAHRVAPPK